MNNYCKILEGDGLYISEAIDKIVNVNRKVAPSEEESEQISARLENFKNFLNEILSKYIAVGCHWVFEWNRMTPVDGKADFVFQCIGRRLYKYFLNPNLDDTYFPKFEIGATMSENGSVDASSMTETSPITATLGEIDTPTGKGVGKNTYNRVHKRNGYKEDLDTLIKYLNSYYDSDIVFIAETVIEMYIFEFREII